MTPAFRLMATVGQAQACAPPRPQATARHAAAPPIPPASRVRAPGGPARAGPPPAPGPTARPAAPPAAQTPEAR
ncbi:MAG: hypothetical protein K0M78_15020, partial [Brevundimonas sp.]|nr:hypothetical protein [Brevundimonas sp.]